VLPSAASPPLSRLGRQASTASGGGAVQPADADAHQLARQPSGCIMHTSSPDAPQPVSRTASLQHTASVVGIPKPPSPLGRSTAITQSSGWDAEQEGQGEEQAAEAASAGVAALQQDSSTGSMADLAPFDGIMEGQLRRLLAQLRGGPSPEVFQGLSRLAHVLPGSAWTSHFSQVGRGSGLGPGSFICWAAADPGSLWDCCTVAKVAWVWGKCC
jgi:hypothetical protein